MFLSQSHPCEPYKKMKIAIAPCGQHFTRTNLQPEWSFWGFYFCIRFIIFFLVNYPIRANFKGDYLWKIRNLHFCELINSLAAHKLQTLCIVFQYTWKLMSTTRIHWPTSHHPGSILVKVFITCEIPMWISCSPSGWESWWGWSLIRGN